MSIQGDAKGELANTPIVLRGRLTCDDFLSIRRYHGLLVFRKPLRWIFGIFLTLLAALGLAATIARWPQVEMVAIVLTIWIVTLWATYLMSPLTQRWLWRRYYRRHAERFKDTEVTLTAARVKVDNELQREDFAWKLVGVVVDNPEGLLFCDEARRPLFWLPERAFESYEVRRRVLQLVEMNNVKVRLLS